MSTIKSDDSNITINASGSGRDIKFQANGVEKASISSAGAFTSTTIDATKLTGDLPAISGANLTGVGVAGISSSADATAMTIDSGERIGIGNTVAGTMNGVNSSILTIGTGSGHSGMTVYTGSTNEGTINFADDTSGSGTYKGMVRYDHNTNALTLHSNGTERLKLTSDGDVRSETNASFWVRFNGTGTPSIADSHNISSVGDWDTGNYGLYLSGSLTNANYAITGIGRSREILSLCDDHTAPTTSRCDIYLHTHAGNATDDGYVYVIGIGGR